jgi:molecular chaperone DnaK
MDRTTGREQSITIQGASTLSEDEVQQMIRAAQEFAETDRLRKEKIDKRNRSETLIVQSERQLREATLDFGMQFVSPYRSRIEPLIKRLRGALEASDERNIDIAEADLRDALYDLQREIYDRNQEEKEEGGFFKAVKDFFLDEEDDYYYDNYGAGGYGYNRGALDYGRGSIGSLPYAGGSSYGRDAYGANQNNYGRDQYDQGSYGQDRYSRDQYGPSGGPDAYGPSGERDRYDRDSYVQGGRDRYERDAYNQGGRDTYGQDYGGQDYGQGKYADRSDPYADRGGYDDQGVAWDSRYDNQGSGERPKDYYDEPPRNTRRKPDRPDYSRDNWDDEDDW